MRARGGKVDNSEVVSLHQRLFELREEHRDLDEAIKVLRNTPAFDQIRLRRLKTRKLHLKDQIARIESKLIPDLDA